eukprot:scaffold4404_cov383-Prasinococcus_capsulatus_cf.AAC.2
MARRGRGNYLPAAAAGAGARPGVVGSLASADYPGEHMARPVRHHWTAPFFEQCYTTLPDGLC